MRDPELTAAFGAKLKAARIAAGLSRQELCLVARVSPANLQNLESGKVAPTLTTLYALAAGLRVYPSELLPDVLPEWLDRVGDL